MTSQLSYKEEAQEIVRLLDIPVHKVSVFSINKPGSNLCPIHGMPSAIVRGVLCFDCYNRHSDAALSAIALVRRIAEGVPE